MSAPPARYTVKPTADAVARLAADRFVAIARTAIDEHGRFRVALSGGGTPKRVYPHLIERAKADGLNWARVEFFWGDERAVPPDHPESNFGVAYQVLLGQLPDARPERIHRMPAEAKDLDAAAMQYEAEIRLAFDARGAMAPAFDLIWLGMGTDGHTASLFPGSVALEETERWVVANWAPGPQAWRMTMTFPLLNAARRVLFVVTGADKAPAIRAIRTGSEQLPAGGVAAADTEWLIDAAAAGEGGG